MAQRPLQLLGQRPLDGGGRGGPQQAGHHPGIGPKAATSLSFQSRGPAAYTSRVPMGPPASSTGTLKAARNWAATSAGATSAQRGSARTSHTATGRRSRQATMQGPAPSSAWTAWARSAGVGGAGPGQQLLLADQHEPSPVGLNRSLAASTTCWRASGRPSLGSRVVRVPMLLPGRPVRYASPSSSQPG